jgi:SAM-dependent methyltransferase
MALEELTWFHPRLMDAALHAEVAPVHAFMRAPAGASLARHADGPDGILIEGSKHWEYSYAIRQAGLAAARGARALDAGCGRSAFTAYLARRGLRVYGVDLLAPPLARLRPYGVDVTLGDLAALPYRDGAFDHVLCISVLEHTADPLRCFDELWRVTREGGTLTVTGDYAPWGLPPRTAAAGRVMDHALLRRLVGPQAMVPPETSALLEGLGYFPQMWPTVLPVYLRFTKDRPEPPEHVPSGAPPAGPAPPSTLDRAAARHLARQCYVAGRHYLHHEWLAEARALFLQAWRLDRRLLRALAGATAARLPRPILRALRRTRAIGSREGKNKEGDIVNRKSTIGLEWEREDEWSRR